MTNCNPCKKEELIEPCAKSCKTRRVIDECTGELINYITTAAAVLLSCNSDKTVDDILSEINSRLSEIETNYSREAIEDIINEYFELNGFANLRDILNQLFEDWSTEVSNMIITLKRAGISEERFWELFNLANPVRTIMLNGVSYTPAPNSDGFVNLGNFESSGLLNTNISSSLTRETNEPLSGTIKLHQISKTGKYEDLIGRPTRLSDLENDLSFNDAKLELTGESIIDLSGTAIVPNLSMISVWFGDPNDDPFECSIYVEALPDPNKDDIWDGLDVKLVVDIMHERENLSDWPNADTNNDGIVDATDINVCVNRMKTGNHIAKRTSDNHPIKLLVGNIYYNIKDGYMFLVIASDSSTGLFKFINLDDKFGTIYPVFVKVGSLKAKTEYFGGDVTLSWNQLSSLIKASMISSDKNIKLITDVGTFETTTCEYHDGNDPYCEITFDAYPGSDNVPTRRILYPSPLTTGLTAGTLTVTWYKSDSITEIQYSYSGQ